MSPRNLRQPAEKAEPIYFNVAGVATVSWDEMQATVLVEWDGWANSAEFRALLEAELTALKEHGGSRLLIDCRRQRPLLPADLERADRDWLPRAVASGLARFAIVLPDSDLAALDLRSREVKFQKSALQVRYFANPEEATLWLAG
jgi:stage II sporulation SpoAA-like protein